jgi:hypothetical protein
MTVIFREINCHSITYNRFLRFKTFYNSTAVVKKFKISNDGYFKKKTLFNPRLFSLTLDYDLPSIFNQLHLTLDSISMSITGV